MAQRAMCHPTLRKPFEVVGGGKPKAKPVSVSDKATESNTPKASTDKPTSGKSKKKKQKPKG